MKNIESQIFGSIPLLDEEDQDYIILKKFIETYPANAFGILNKLLNTKQFIIQIGVLS